MCVGVKSERQFLQSVKAEKRYKLRFVRVI